MNVSSESRPALAIIGIARPRTTPSSGSEKSADSLVRLGQQSPPAQADLARAAETLMSLRAAPIERKSEGGIRCLNHIRIGQSIIPLKLSQSKADKVVTLLRKGAGIKQATKLSGAGRYTVTVIAHELGMTNRPAIVHQGHTFFSNADEHCVIHALAFFRMGMSNRRIHEATQLSSESICDLLRQYRKAYPLSTEV